ncbi:unnamed protein product [Rotaria socialis]|uniref:VLIG-type G domain-containing protein n=1 Tax=Rotaria socialis TaxID=392032 RepID=A0A820TU01_9BILA|nr:unnamed protein product [Rotaria socialis]
MTSSEGNVTTIRRKLALIIGNQNYEIRPLKNPEKDANDLSKVLRRIGFQVELGINCTYDAMNNLISRFTNRITDEDLVLFYFAGHGFQQNERNFILPIDTTERFDNETIIGTNTLNVQDILEKMKSNTSYATIFILDCCRQYRFRNRNISQDSTKQFKGLFKMTAPAGSLIQFACAPGKLAADDSDQAKNGLFTKHLLKHIARPSIDVDILLRAVANGVFEESKGEQTPYRDSCLMTIGNIYLNTEEDGKNVLVAFSLVCESLPACNDSNNCELLFTIASIGLFYNQRIIEVEWNKIYFDEICNNDFGISTFLSPEKSIFQTKISREKVKFNPNQLLTTFKCFAVPASVDLNGSLDKNFCTIIDKPCNKSVLTDLINTNQTLLPYILDSLKRYHALTDIHSTLLGCNELTKEFVSIPRIITKRTLLIVAIECLSLESQRYFGTYIRKNDLPIPLSYYISDTCDSASYKINFNCLIEVLCLSTDRLCIQFGSESCVGLGKTSIIPFIFNDKRRALLFNKREDSHYRSSCIDVVFGTTNNSSYVIFDVHGSLNSEKNILLVRAIQLYATIQVLYISPNDLNETNEFFEYMINQGSPLSTIVCIFDDNFDDERSMSMESENELTNRFQTYANQHNFGENILCTVVPILKTSNDLSEYDINTRAERLIPTFARLFCEFEESMRIRPQFRSIFAIQHAYLRKKTHPAVIKFEVENKFRQLFNNLSDETENLKIITPISYYRSQIDSIQKRLVEMVDSTNEISQLAARLKEITLNRRKYKEVNPYAEFMIGLLQYAPYVCLEIIDFHLGKWRLRYASELNSEKEKLKKDAEDIKNKLSSEKKQNPNEITAIIKQLDEQSKILQRKINDKNAQIANVDLTVGLMIDELFALYDYLHDEQPILFDKYEMDFRQVADTLARLVYRGLGIHILRSRPLLCQSGLMEICLKQLRVTEDGQLATLTVIGEQSSAKSSLLNTTFGYNFRVSAGRCTIGMYLGVVYYKNMTIIILDTEGLLSLEESGSIFDNQMITMAVLSSHIVLINHKGELSASLEGLIGMSLFAKLHLQTSPLKPKLMFVLRDQMDRGQEVFVEQLAKLRNNLRKSSSFLRVSIDNELEIREEHLALLPCAFSEDTNVDLNLTQRWRNQTFPSEIMKLRSQIFQALDEHNITPNFSFKNFDYFSKKICVNWSSIDQLGQGLLECKTLYELSVTNELKEIAKTIVTKKSEQLQINGGTMLKELLESRENQTQINPDIYMRDLIKKGIQQLDNLTSDLVHEANNEFESSTPQSYFAELRPKVKKNIEPSIRCNQQVLQAQFEEDIYTVARVSATIQVQKQLLASAKTFFDRKSRTTDDVEELNQALELKHKELKCEFEKSLNLLRKSHEEIIKTIHDNYNQIVRSRRANTKTDDIYNRCPPFDYHRYLERCTQLDNIFGLNLKFFSTKQKDSSFLHRLRERFISAENKILDELQWFRDHRDYDRNREIFQQISEELIPNLHKNIVKMLANIRLAYSDPQTIANLIDYVDNAVNGTQSCIQKYYKQINLQHIVADLIFIALRCLIDEAIMIAGQKDLEMLKALDGLEVWMNNIKEQFILISDSDQQARKFAADFLDQLFEEIMDIFKDTIHTEISLKITANPHIDPERIARNAYDNSIGSNPPNGDNIMKYVLDINRYYMELALDNVKLSADNIVASQILKLQNLISNCIDTSIDVVNKHECLNVQQVYQSIIQALQSVIPGLKAENLVGISAEILEPEQFRYRFLGIRDQREDLIRKVENHQKEFDEKARHACRVLISQRLGCQACCPGCGTKCDNTELIHNKHRSAHHLAMAFKGWRYINTKYPLLNLCYQNWDNTAAIIIGDDRFSPRRTYYEERAPEWLDDLNDKARTGDMHGENIPPFEQRRAWITVHHALVKHYATIDHPSYDRSYYPSSIDSLPADYEPKWIYRS